VAKEKHSGRLIGIEINELVSAEAIRTQITAKTPESAYYHWTHRDVLDALQEYLMTRMLRSTKTDLPMRFMGDTYRRTRALAGGIWGVISGACV
jgi:Arc/MetJ family transcription regulator